MAQARTASFATMKIWLGDGNTPENFENVGAFTDKSFKRKAATGSTDVPDVDNPDAPMWEEVEVKTLSFEFSGSGVLNKSDMPMWDAWYLGGMPKNVRVMRDYAGADGGGYFQGQALLTDFTETGKKGEKVSVSATISSTGAFSWVPNA